MNRTIRKARKTLLLLGMLLAMTTMTKAQTDEQLTEVTDASKQLEKINEAGKKVETITCKYEMTRRVPLMKEQLTDNGAFAYSRKAGGISLKSEKTPGERTVMTHDVFISESNGKTTRVSASKSPVMTQMLNLVTGCLTGDFSKLETQGNLTYLKGKTTFVVIFVPTDKRASRFLKEIRLTFLQKDWSLEELHMEQNGNDQTTYRFSKEKIYNAEVPENTFR